MDWGILAGDTDQTIYVRLRDSTTGLAKTGLAYNSTGAVCSYVLPTAARAAITLATQTVTGAHSDGGFVEVDATNCKGLYRLDLPDAAIASGKFSVISIEFDGIIEESVLVPLTLRKSNVKQISDDGTAADTLELFAEALDQATGQLDAGTLQDDTITAASIATDAIAADGLATDAVNEIQSGLSTHSAADVWAVATRVLTAATNLDALAQADTMEGFFQIALRSDSAIATDRSAILTLLNADEGSGAGDYAVTTESQEAIRDWIADGTNLTEAGGDGDHLTVLATQASVNTIDGIVDAIVIDTNELQTDWTDGGRLDLIVDAILALLDDARGEPGQGAPPVNPDLATKIDYLYKAWRNKKEQTATLLTIYADDGSTADHKATISDDLTTTTVEEMVTGA